MPELAVVQSKCQRCGRESACFGGRPTVVATPCTFYWSCPGCGKPIASTRNSDETQIEQLELFAERSGK